MGTGVAPSPLDRMEELLAKRIENPIQSIEAQLQDVSFPKMQEVALSHPLHKSSVRLNDDGTMDIFVEDDCGIKLDPLYESIHFVADKLVHHLNHVQSHINKELKVEIKGKTTVLCHSDIDVKSKRNIKVSSDGTISVNGKVKIDINSSGSIEIKSSQPIRFKAPKYIFE